MRVYTDMLHRDATKVRAQLQARYAGMSEALRGRMIALIEDRQRR